jgi:hypothetical protein
MDVMKTIKIEEDAIHPFVKVPIMFADKDQDFQIDEIKDMENAVKIFAGSGSGPGTDLSKAEADLMLAVATAFDTNKDKVLSYGERSAMLHLILLVPKSKPGAVNSLEVFAEMLYG